MVELPQMWPHQAKVISDVRHALVNHKRVVLCGVTGFGKSRSSKYIMACAANREPGDRQSGYSLFAVHRRGLVDNIDQSFNESPELPHGVLMSGIETDHSHRCQVGSIDTLLSWYCEDGAYAIDRTYDLIVFDECHSHLTKLQKFLAAHDKKRQEQDKHPAYVLGLSATPQCKGLSKTFRNIVQGPSPSWLQNNGYAARFEYLVATTGDLSKLKKSGNDFTAASIGEAMDGLGGELVRDWKKHARGRPTVGFFARLAEAREACELLNQAGVSAAYVDGKTPDDDRRTIYDMLGSGQYEYICNVGVIERGTDLPTIACVQVCTSVGSVTRWLQMIGRGSRVADGKQDCLVMDHGGNLKRLQVLWEDDIRWTLDMSAAKAKDQAARAVIECPQCGVVYRGGLCRSCGYEPTAKERKAQGLMFTGSELKPFKKQKLVQKDPEKLLVSCLYRAARTGRTWRQACGMFCSIARKEGIPHRVPRTFQIAGREYEAIPYAHPDGNRSVNALFSFME